jgi:hypothetical protein
MNRSDIGRVPQQAERTTMPGTTRQSATTAPIGSREQQFRTRDMMQRGAPSQRGAATDDAKDDDDDKKEPVVDRDELTDEDKDEDEPSGLDNEENDDDPKNGKKAKKAA